MFADRIEAKWIDTFEKAFELCKVEKGESVAYCSSGARVACTTGKVTSCSFRAYVWPAIPTVSHDLPPTALALAAVPWLLSLSAK